MSADESGSPDWDAVTHDLRAAVRAAGGREREVIALGVAAGRRAGRGGYRGPSGVALLQAAATGLWGGDAIEAVLEDLRR